MAKQGIRLAKRKKIEINNPKFQNKIFKVTPAHLKCLYILQSIYQRKLILLQ